VSSKGNVARRDPCPISRTVPVPVPVPVPENLKIGLFESGKMCSNVADEPPGSVDRRAMATTRAESAACDADRWTQCQAPPSDGRGDDLDLRTGAPWRDLPHAYGPWHSVYTRFSRWSQSGVLAALFEALGRERDGEGYLIDATIVRAHQDASGGAKKGGAKKLGVHAGVPTSRHMRPRRSTRWSMRSATL
jgi:hypothetical protein